MRCRSQSRHEAAPRRQPVATGRHATHRSGPRRTHVADLGLLAADDGTILQRAEDDGYVLVTADTDFPMLVALRRATSPSVVLLRRVSELPPRQHAELLVANLPAVAEDLSRGAIVTISPGRVRVRDLPVD